MAKNKQRQDGLFRAWYHGKQFYGKTDAEAKAKRDAYKYECEHGIEQQEPISVYDLVQEWMKSKVGIQTNTYNQYTTCMEKLTGAVGNKLVSAVTPGDIKKVWTLYADKSQSYINKAVFLYKSFFQYAIENGYCRQNPIIAPSAKPHKGTKGSHRALEKWEVELIETTPHRCQAAAMFMLKAGLRRGEMLALRKADIYNGLIHVNSAVKFVKNRPVEGNTKNESSNRNVPLFDSLSPLIDTFDDLLLPSAENEICSETAFTRAWESYMLHLSKKAGRPVNIRPHDLRHTFVSDCRDKGVDLHVCMTWCGHSSERMILEIYDHISKDREQTALDLINGTVKKQLNSEEESAKMQENQLSHEK